MAVEKKVTTKTTLSTKSPTSGSKRAKVATSLNAKLASPIKTFIRPSAAGASKSKSPSTTATTTTAAATTTTTKSSSSASPKFADRIIEAIEWLNERTGSSMNAIKKHIVAKYKPAVSTAVLQRSLRNGVQQALRESNIKQTTGTGMSGSFKLSVEYKRLRALKAKREAKKSSAAAVVAVTSKNKTTTGTAGKKAKVGKKKVTKRKVAIVKKKAPTTTSIVKSPKSKLTTTARGVKKTTSIKSTKSKRPSLASAEKKASIKK